MRPLAPAGGYRPDNMAVQTSGREADPSNSAEPSDPSNAIEEADPSAAARRPPSDGGYARRDGFGANPEGLS